MKSYLYKKQFADADFFAALDVESDALAADLRAQCLALPDPEPLSIFDHVYAERAPARAARSATSSPRYLASFEDA